LIPPPLARLSHSFNFSVTRACRPGLHAVAAVAAEMRGVRTRRADAADFDAAGRGFNGIISD